MNFLLFFVFLILSFCIEETSLERTRNSKGYILEGQGVLDALELKH